MNTRQINNLLKQTVSVKFKNIDESSTIREYGIKEIKFDGKIEW